MGFNQQDKAIDSRGLFTEIESPDFYKLYHQYNDTFLKLLTDRITNTNSRDKKKKNKNENNNDKQRTIRIADYGGGNGLLAKLLLRKLYQKKKKGKIDIIDIDGSKKNIPENSSLNIQKNIRFINQDVIKYHKKKYYDYSLSRFLVHYFDIYELKKFMINVYNNLKPNSYFLLINWIVDGKANYKRKRNILDIIEKEKISPVGPYRLLL